jgi:hypothetical protein
MRCSPGLSGTFSPVRFERGTCGIAAISKDFQGNLPKFLCDPDCVAEREEFEPAVRFLKWH